MRSNGQSFSDPKEPIFSLLKKELKKHIGLLTSKKSFVEDKSTANSSRRKAKSNKLFNCFNYLSI